MLLVKLLLLIFLNCSSGNLVEVTFKNVTFHGYQMFTPRFKPIILLGNNLKNYIPNSDFDNIEFIDQHIPVLYKDAVADIDELNDLNMEFCQVREIRPGAFRNLSHLNRLSLKMNKIERIGNGVFNNLVINSLDLSYNQISNIYPDAFNDMPEISQINLAYNLLSVWNPEWFKNTPKLAVLYFKNNFIEELPAHSFKNFKRDRFFSLDLIFTQNRISSIDQKAFSGLKHINILSLSNNLIQKFDKHLLRNIEVKDLRLNNNSIKCFEDDLEEVFQAKYIYIEYNPFECACLKRIQRWSKMSDKDVGVADTKCAKDEDKKVENLVDIEEVREVAKDIYAIDRITLVLPNKPKTRNIYNNLH